VQVVDEREAPRLHHLVDVGVVVEPEADEPDGTPVEPSDQFGEARPPLVVRQPPGVLIRGPRRYAPDHRRQILLRERPNDDLAHLDTEEMSRRAFDA
jgi:hypothetical protein